MAQISVIIPVYNCEKYIEDSIKSILAQTFTDWELLLVNDGSTDASADICYTYAGRDARIRVVEKENGGGGGEARNVGMAHATADFFAFLDADDLYQRDMLETLLDIQKEGDYDCVVMGYEEFYDTEPSRYPAFYKDAVCRNQKEVRDFFVAHYPETLLGVPWNKLYRASIIREYGLKMPRMRRLEDGIFNVEYFAHCNSVRITEKIGTCYRESRQVEQGKLPYDFYDIMKVFVKHYYETLERWGYPAKDFDRPMVDYFQNDFVCCLENIQKPVWQRPGKERKAYIRSLREEKLVDTMVNRPCETGRYTKIAMKLYRNRQFGLLWLWMKAKYVLKVRFGPLFYRLKERVN